MNDDSEQTKKVGDKKPKSKVRDDSLVMTDTSNLPSKVSGETRTKAKRIVQDDEFIPKTVHPTKEKILKLIETMVPATKEGHDPDFIDISIEEAFACVAEPPAVVRELGNRQFDTGNGRIPKFRMICARGRDQFNFALKNYKTEEQSFLRRTDDISTTLIDFYHQIFKDSERDEINALADHMMIWHIVIFVLETR